MFTIRLPDTHKVGDTKESKEEYRIRQELAAQGWRLMRRRKATSKNLDQFWLMLEKPVTLAEAADIPFGKTNKLLFANTGEMFKHLSRCGLMRQLIDVMVDISLPHDRPLTKAEVVLAEKIKNKFAPRGVANND
jgi:hypothetical protein